jgi:hypothetical protein
MSGNNLMKKLTFQLILLLTIFAVVSGCAKQVPISGVQVPQKRQSSVVSETASSTVVNKNATDPKVVATSSINVHDWQTYENKKLGFKVKIPRNWVFKNDGPEFVRFEDRKKKVFVENSEMYLVGVYSHEFENNSDFDAYINYWKTSKFVGKGTLNKLVLKNKEAFQRLDFTGINTLIIETDKKRVFVVSKSVPATEYRYLEDIYNQILNEFNFIGG